MTTRKTSETIRFSVAVLALAIAACSGKGLGGTNNSDATVDPDASLCGVGDDEKNAQQAPKIFHGTEDPEICMSPGQQLAVGALTFQSYGWTNGCTGTLIADDVVLTAAHCVQNWNGDPMSPDRVRFVVGENAIYPDHTFTVSATFAHQSYNGDADHDLGMLKLAQGVTAAGVDAIPIPVNQLDLATGFLGEIMQNVGYGATEVDDENHWQLWTTEPVTEVQPGWFQVFGGGAPNGSSVCYGDSGGPSLWLRAGASLRLVGTVSWGDPSCMDYDYFARADDNLAFIEQQTGTLDPCVGITSAGLCDEDVALWCENGELRQQCCAATGQACGPDPMGNSRCTGASQCGGITYEGECQGSDAVWCENGELRRRRCEPCNQTCGWAGPALGYYCIDLTP
ncbi:MAG: trypsin-like serine protease [bacterium]